MSEAAYLPFLQQTLRYFDRPHTSPAVLPISSPAAWKRRDLENARWRVRLTPDEISEVQRAVSGWQARKLPLANMTLSDFPLPTLAPSIAAWRREVSEGRGLQVVSGVPVHGWTVEESSAFFWGLGQHLGLPGAQNRKGDLLGHVRDTGADKVDRYVRQYMTTQNIPFHCDAADMVGLLCLTKARSGGLSRIASSVSVYNELLRRRPDLAPRLFEPFMLDTRDEAEANGMKVLPVPPCRHAGGRAADVLALGVLPHVAAPRGRPADRGRERAVRPVRRDIGNSPEFFIDMDLEPGDIQLLSNHTVIHARTDYVDHPEPDRKRHLLRLWITVRA